VIFFLVDGVHVLCVCVRVLLSFEMDVAALVFFFVVVCGYVSVCQVAFEFCGYVRVQGGEDSEDPLCL